MSQASSPQVATRAARPVDPAGHLRGGVPAGQLVGGGELVGQSGGGFHPASPAAQAGLLAGAETHAQVDLFGVELARFDMVAQGLDVFAPAGPGAGGVGEAGGPAGGVVAAAHDEEVALGGAQSGEGGGGGHGVGDSARVV